MTAASARAGVTGVAACLGVAGAGLLFAPREMADAAGATGPDVVYQLFGATLLALASMNHIARGSALGGIYGRAIVTADQVHFTIGAIALVRYAVARTDAARIGGACGRIRRRRGVLQSAAVPRGRRGEAGDFRLKAEGATTSKAEATGQRLPPKGGSYNTEGGSYNTERRKRQHRKAEATTEGGTARLTAKATSRGEPTRCGSGARRVLLSWYGFSPLPASA